MKNSWQEQFPIDLQPTMEQMKEYVTATYFEKLMDYLTVEYQPKFSIRIFEGERPIRRVACKSEKVRW